MIGTTRRVVAQCVTLVAGLGLACVGCSSTTTESSPNVPGGSGGDSSQQIGTGGANAAPAGEVGGPVALSGVDNARQTGGLATLSGQHVRANVLIRAGELSRLDAAGCDALTALGVRTVIDLRAASAVAAGPDASCVTDATEYYNADLPKLLPPTEQSYLQTLDAAEPVLSEIFTRLSAPEALPAIIHCVIGRDRASMMMALLLLALGVPQDDVLDDFANNQETDVDPAWMNGVLARIEQAGGIESYLEQHGVTSDQLAQLKQQALE